MLFCLLFSKNSLSKSTFNVLSTSPCLVQFLNSTIPWEHKICTIRGPPVFKKVSTKIHPKNVHKNSRKERNSCGQKVHKNSPKVSTRSLRPNIKSLFNTKSACSYIPQLKTTKLIRLITKPNV